MSKTRAGSSSASCSSPRCAALFLRVALPAAQLPLAAQPGGHLLLSTISRTPLARLLTITLAEDVLRLVTPGTHTYHKYLKPSELRDFFADKRWDGFEVRGCPYDPIAGKWRLLELGQFGGAGELVNYFAGVRRPLQ